MLIIEEASMTVKCRTAIKTIVFYFNLCKGESSLMFVYIYTGADPGFQVREGARKKIAPSGGRHENFWGISCEKSRFYAKKSYFFPILGGRAPGAPPWIRPCLYSSLRTDDSEE